MPRVPAGTRAVYHYFSNWYKQLISLHPRNRVTLCHWVASARFFSLKTAISTVGDARQVLAHASGLEEPAPWITTILGHRFRIQTKTPRYFQSSSLLASTFGCHRAIPRPGRPIGEGDRAIVPRHISHDLSLLYSANKTVFPINRCLTVNSQGIENVPLVFTEPILVRWILTVVHFLVLKSDRLEDAILEVHSQSC